MSMRNLLSSAILLALVGCSSGEYITDVSTDSHREEYKTEATVAKVITEVASETNLDNKVMPSTTAEPVMNKTMSEPVPSKPRVTHSNQNMIKIVPPTDEQSEKFMRYGYTIQVMAVDSSEKARALANQLPKGHPIWEHYKQVKGTNWYAVLYGDYATKSEAKAAIATLPKSFQDKKPFVKSLDEIKKSAYPTLNKLW